MMVTHLGLLTLQEPGSFEARAANLAKRFFIRLASRQGTPQRQADTKASIEAAGTHYGPDCGVCHGVDGPAQTPSGRWMYHLQRISPVSECRAKRQLYN